VINRVNQPNRVTCSIDSGGRWKHLSGSHIHSSRNAEEWAVTGSQSVM